MHMYVGPGHHSKMQCLLRGVGEHSMAGRCPTQYGKKGTLAQFNILYAGCPELLVTVFGRPNFMAEKPVELQLLTFFAVQY